MNTSTVSVSQVKVKCLKWETHEQRELLELQEHVMYSVQYVKYM